MPNVAQPRRRDGDLLLTGRCEFLDDIPQSGLLHAAILRSPHPHALIKAVDARAAEQRPGVRLVLTATDAQQHLAPMPPGLEPALLGCNPAQFHCLTPEHVRWVGEPVAAIVGESLAEAEAALESIEVTYELLEHVLDIEQALAPDAPRLYEDWPDNVLGRFPCLAGDAASAIAAAPHRLSDTVRIGRHAGVPLEPRGYMAAWDRAGRLTCWASTQNPHPMRTNLAETLRMPEDKIRVVAPRLGGAFGHKFKGYPEEALVCLLSRLAGAPVKWLETRAECLLPGARESVHNFEVGFDGEGRVLGLHCRSLCGIGAFAAWGGWTMAIVTGSAFPGPYKIKDYDIESAAVVTNKAPWAGYRGFGKEQTTVVLERMMDLVAEHLDLDPIEVRLRNVIQPEEFPYWTTSMHLDSGDYPGALEKVVKLSGWPRRRRGRRQPREDQRLLGVGVAFELCPEGGDFAATRFRGFDTTTIRIQPDGTVIVLTGVTDPGSGNATSIAQLVAGELGVVIDGVRVSMGDTDVSPYGYGNFSSRSLATGGSAAVLAARELKQHLSAAAAAMFSCESASVTFADNVVSCAENPEQAMPFATLVDTVFKLRLVVPGLDQPILEVTKTEHPHNFHHLPDEHGRTSAYASFPYSAHVAEVAVDRETGVVEVLGYWIVDDCGLVISPNHVEGQLFGAIAQGIGGALWEDQPYDAASGQPEATTFKHYLLPRATDLPTPLIGHQETPSPYTLLGTKGAGESAIGGAMAVMLAAVNDAIAPLGVRTSRLPLSPPNLLEVILHGEGA